MPGHWLERTVPLKAVVESLDTHALLASLTQCTYCSLVVCCLPPRVAMLFVKILFFAKVILVGSFSSDGDFRVHFRVRFGEIQTFVSDSKFDFGFFIHSRFTENNFDRPVSRRVVLHFFDKMHCAYFRHLFDRIITHPRSREVVQWLNSAQVDARLRCLGPNYFGGSVTNYEPDVSSGDPEGWAMMNWESVDVARAFVPFYNCQNYVFCRPTGELLRWIQDPRHAAYFHFQGDNGQEWLGQSDDIDRIFYSPIDSVMEEWLGRLGTLDHLDYGLE
jgi:hypothetical protein